MLAGIIVAAPGVLGFLPVKTSEARRRCFCHIDRRSWRPRSGQKWRLLRD
jgi:hypothetical protein